ncbi:hypothetical protein D3C85_1200730 [compost metagenome]
MGQGRTGTAAARRQLPGIHREREDRPLPRRGLRVHAQGPHHGAAQRLHRGRLRLRRAHRCRQHLHRLPHQPPPGAAVRTAAERRDGGDRHRAWRPAEPGLAQLRRHRQGPHPYPPRPQAAAPLRVHQPGRTPAEQGPGRLREPSGQDQRRARPGCPRRIPPGRDRRPAGRHRPRQPHGLCGRAPPAGQRRRPAAKPGRPAGDPRHRRPGAELRQVLHADPGRPDCRPPVRRQGHGRAPGQLPQHQ